ncbi:hypothetical protein FJT64_021049 [Amphibalanus amphitrite]|uniref:Peptidase S1 domain-containing protein n=1 Tax=Amphibalanus amphitrite TaxID=1232801 RepID=A0A6A4WNM4_AMPAM|nr:hypothetical protein FJT64_021049 [Amphibalanus amphitrite]
MSCAPFSWCRCYWRWSAGRPAAAAAALSRRTAGGQRLTAVPAGLERHPALARLDLQFCGSGSEAQVSRGPLGCGFPVVGDHPWLVALGFQGPGGGAARFIVWTCSTRRRRPARACAYRLLSERPGRPARCLGAGAPCRADLGGPLVAADRFGTAFYLLGVASVRPAPSECGRPGAAVTYAPVQPHVAWILDSIDRLA